MQMINANLELKKNKYRTLKQLLVKRNIINYDM